MMPAHWRIPGAQRCSAVRAPIPCDPRIHRWQAIQELSNASFNPQTQAAHSGLF
jgi:hypothetical protein